MRKVLTIKENVDKSGYVKLKSPVNQIKSHVK